MGVAPARNAPSVRGGSGRFDAPGQAIKPVTRPPETSALDDYDQMIFNQFMEDDEDEKLAQQM